jgi:hypothetical protein
MGMAVCGNNPSSKTGEYFEAAGLLWLPLAQISQHFAPEVCAACKYWDSNDGDGLDADGARRLAVALEQALVAGQIDAYLAERAQYLATLPNEVCQLCGGTGVRRDALGIEDKQPERVIDQPGHPRHGETGWCNGCDGRGWNENWTDEDGGNTDRETVTRWIAFLKDCGGFSIN